MKQVTTLLAFLALTALPALAFAGPCDDLSPAHKKVVDAVFASEYPYDGCDETFATCLKSTPVHPLVTRLADWMCQKAATGADEATLKRSLERRGLSMMRPGKTYEISQKNAAIAGCLKSPVEVTIYACARCPYCSKLIPEIYKEATTGQLAGKVKLIFKPFPIKSHKYSTEANQALQAAIDLNRGWEFLLAMYAKFDGFSLDRLTNLAIEAGLDKAAFADMSAKKEVREHLVEAKKEGLRNGVEATPTFFINGRRFLGDLDSLTLVDCILEEGMQ
ncbi:thioredoxin domain-containing protein [Myxococcota bacterium]|nr:thioredoxin domain-containing protein [Myxococcota bacterium]OQC41175.1 MAG: DSBA-like thioredoxin domain protein [Deltaproteobacteria bacterium ADurb.Bin058]